jgi:hypothetical protein
LSLTRFVSRVDLAGARVDRDKGILFGVRIATQGDARGHGKIVDATTLKQVKECAAKYKNGLRVKFNPSTFNHGDGGLAGFIPSPSLKIENDALLGDLHVYKTYFHRDYLFEMAEMSPENFGLSMEFSGVHEERDGVTYARCEEIFAATIVDLPAANPTGLFSAAGEINEGDTMNKDETVKLIQDTLKDELPKIIGGELSKELAKFRTEFRMAQGNTSSEEATQEEKDAAGVTPEDTPEQAASKVNAWRAKADKPVTLKDLMGFYRFTGGRPVSSSAGAEGNGDTVTHPFAGRIERYKAAGMSEGKAIMRARADHGKEYNDWVKKGRPKATTVKS